MKELVRRGLVLYTQAGLIDDMSGAKRGRSDTPLNDRQNPALAVSQLFKEETNE